MGEPKDNNITNPGELLGKTCKMARSSPHLFQLNSYLLALEDQKLQI